MDTETITIELTRHQVNELQSALSYAKDHWRGQHQFKLSTRIQHMTAYDELRAILCASLHRDAALDQRRKAELSRAAADIVDFSRDPF